MTVGLGPSAVDQVVWSSTTRESKEDNDSPSQLDHKLVSEAADAFYDLGAWHRGDLVRPSGCCGPDLASPHASSRLSTSMNDWWSAA